MRILTRLLLCSLAFAYLAGTHASDEYLVGLGRFIEGLLSACCLADPCRRKLTSALSTAAGKADITGPVVDINLMVRCCPIPRLPCFYT